MNTIQKIDLTIVILLLCIYFIALLNLFLFGMMESKADRSDGLKGIGVVKDKNEILVFSKNIALISLFLCSVYVYLSNDFITSSLIIAMLLVMILAIRTHDRLSQYDLYRSIGDGVFLFPLIIFWL